MLSKMTPISARSNSRPARVSASKITVYQRRRQPVSGLSGAGAGGGTGGKEEDFMHFQVREAGRITQPGEQSP